MEVPENLRGGYTLGKIIQISRSNYFIKPEKYCAMLRKGLERKMILGNNEEIDY